MANSVTATVTGKRDRRKSVVDFDQVEVKRFEKCTARKSSSMEMMKFL